MIYWFHVQSTRVLNMKTVKFEIYHDTLASAFNELRDYVQAKLGTIPEQFDKITYCNHIAYGTTFSDNIEFPDLKNGLCFQIYRIPFGSYELNCYTWK